MNRFLAWIGLKEQLDASSHRPPFVSEGDIWWASLGENVGTEINGKSDRFSRPVIVLKKLAKGSYLVIPMTSRPNSGSWYVSFPYRKRGGLACLHQARVIDYRRLWSKLDTLHDADLIRLREGFHALYCAKNIPRV